MVKLLRLMRVGIIYFVTQNKGVFLLSFITICVSFLGTIITLHLTGENIQNHPEISVPLEEINWFEIFQHNLIVISPVILGVFTFGFISFWYIVLQSYLLGLTIYYSCQQIPLLIVLKYTVPHGIFELLAMCFAGAFALKPFVVTIKCILFDGPFINKSDLRDMVIILFLFLMFLLIASLVEGLITAQL